METKLRAATPVTPRKSGNRKKEEIKKKRPNRDQFSVKVKASEENTFHDPHW